MTFTSMFDPEAFADIGLAQLAYRRIEATGLLAPRSSDCLFSPGMAALSLGNLLSALSVAPQQRMRATGHYHQQMRAVYRRLCEAKGARSVPHCKIWYGHQPKDDWGRPVSWDESCKTCPRAACTRELACAIAWPGGPAKQELGDGAAVRSSRVDPSTLNAWLYGRKRPPIAMLQSAMKEIRGRGLVPFGMFREMEELAYHESLARKYVTTIRQMVLPPIRNQAKSDLAVLVGVEPDEFNAAALTPGHAVGIESLSWCERIRPCPELMRLLDEPVTLTVDGVTFSCRIRITQDDADSNAFAESAPVERVFLVASFNGTGMQPSQTSADTRIDIASACI